MDINEIAEDISTRINAIKYDLGFREPELAFLQSLADALPADGEFISMDDVQECYVSNEAHEQLMSEAREEFADRVKNLKSIIKELEEELENANLRTESLKPVKYSAPRLVRS